MSQVHSTLQPGVPFSAGAADFIAAVARLRPRLAVFDCDGTLWAGDSGEQFLYWGLNHQLFSETVAEKIQARYRDYRAGKVSEEDMCGEMVTIHEGLRTDDLNRTAREYFQEKFVAAIFPEMRELVDRLHRDGCEIWAVSSTNDWVVATGAAHFGIPEERILAACVYCENGIATGRLRRVPTDQDKAVAIREVIGRPVDAAFGNSVHDAAMLELASQAFAINPNPDLLQMAQTRGWNIYFPTGTAKTSRP